MSPCTYTGSIDGDTIHSQGQTIKKLKKDLDDITKIACETLQKLTPAQLKTLDKKTQQWWQQHQKADQERLTKQLNKLIKKHGYDKTEELLEKISKEE